MNILIKNANVLLADGKVKIADIAIKDSKILAIENIPETFKAEKVIDGTDKLATAGFVNAHTHVSMTLLRSYADDMKLMDWLENKIWPIEAKMKKEDIYWGAMLGIAEMIKSGTTTFADMYGDMDQVAQACIDTDIRAVLSRGIIGVAPNGNQALEENNIETVESEITMIPDTTVKVEGKDAEKMQTLIDMLEEHDDVQNVYSNYEMDEE